MKLDGYIRVSRVNGRKGPSYISPDVQRDAIQAWADAHGHVIAEWFQEEDRSAGAGKRRPIFDEVMARVTSGASDGIVVWKFSRFGRSQLEASTRLYKIEKANGVVESATEGDQSKLTRTIMLAIAEDELDRLTDTWGEAQKRAIKRGVWIGKPPVGYLRDADGALVLDDATWRIVRRAFEVAAADGLHAAGAFLETEFPTKRWRTADVRRVLRNRAYLGEHHNATGPAHPAIVDFDVWTEAQTEPRSRRSNGDYPLSGIATCQCGAPLIGALQHVNGRTYRRMRCSDTSCRGGSAISAEKLEGYVREQLAAKLGDRRFRISLAPVGLDEARDALSLAETERKRYAVDLAAREALGDDAWLAGARARTAAVEEAQEAYQLIAGQSARSEVLPAASELDDDEQLLRAVRAAVISISVRPGRGDVADRVSLVLVGDDLDDRAGMLAA